MEQWDETMHVNKINDNCGRKVLCLKKQNMKNTELR